MKKVDLLIKNARYYANDTFLTGDIFIFAGKISAITLPGAVAAPEAARVLDAAGLWVLPGIIDSHVHFREPGRTDREDFYTGSLAAAAGGVTTICEMPIAYPPTHSPEVLANRRILAEEKSLVDVAFYGAAGFANRYRLQELLDAGVIAFKTFLHPAPEGREGEFVGLTVADDGQLYLMLKEAAKTKGRYFFHCENYKLIEAMENYLHEQGEEGYDFHYKSRPNIAETESVATIIQFAKATGAKVGISHISTKEACRLVRDAQREGLDIVAETCFHYLTFDERDIDRMGSYAKCNPPLRSAEDLEQLWKYIENGTITLIGSDHAPFIPAEKEIGIKEGIWRAYSGLPAIECLLPIMLNHVNSGRLSLSDLARLMSENPAKTFGLYPHKGCLAVGSSADLTIIDLEKKYQLAVKNMQSKAREINLLFDGLELQGAPLYTILRGEFLLDEGRVQAQKRGVGKAVRS